MLKALFVLKIFNVCPDAFNHVEKWLDKKAKINFKRYVRTGKDQLIGCNVRNIFLEESYTKCGEEGSPRSFFKKSKFQCSFTNQADVG